MKKSILFIIIGLSSINVNGQDTCGLSIEIDANYYYHFVGGNTNNRFNYGFSLLISKKLEKLKISLGLDYSTLYYYYDVEPTSPSFLKMREYDLQYINVPLLIGYEAKKNKSLKIVILGGVIFNKIVSYHLTSYYLNAPPITENGSYPSNNLGLTIRFGTDISKALSKRFNLNAGPFVDYKLIKNGQEQRPDSRNTPDIVGSLGFKLGIEYNF